MPTTVEWIRSFLSENCRVAAASGTPYRFLSPWPASRLRTRSTREPDAASSTPCNQALGGTIQKGIVIAIEEDVEDFSH